MGRRTQRQRARKILSGLLAAMELVRPAWRKFALSARAAASASANSAWEIASTSPAESTSWHDRRLRPRFPTFSNVRQQTLARIKSDSADWTDKRIAEVLGEQVSDFMAGPEGLCQGLPIIELCPMLAMPTDVFRISSGLDLGDLSIEWMFKNEIQCSGRG